MNAKDRAFLMYALIEVNAGFERAGKFITSKENCDRLYEITQKVSREEMDKEIAKLRKGLKI